MSASLREGGRYRSLFEELPPLRADERALHVLGRPGGPCDLGADPTGDTDSAVAAVWPFFGQFIAHDITADRSPLVHRSDPARIRNFRVPKANLEGLYGDGPARSCIAPTTSPTSRSSSPTPPTGTATRRRSARSASTRGSLPR